jgi:hypothetical protein
MNNKPVAYVDNVWINRPDLAMDLGIGQMFSRCQLSDHQIPLYTHPLKELTDEEINVVAILQDAEIVPVGHEIWKTNEEFNKYKRIVLATAKALRKAQEK